MDVDLVERLRRQVSALSAIGADEDGGVTRLAFTSQEREAHALVSSWMNVDGARCETDAAGNTVFVYREGEPYILLGSHLDSVRNGGRYDGVAGVLAAIAVAQECADIERGLRVVAFAGEEGARFGRPNLGSALATGLLKPGDSRRLVDGEGISLDRAAQQVGLDLDRIEPWLNDRVAFFLELHIEQGAVLESTGTSIGLVDAIAGSVRLRATFSGLSAHSGSTPMFLRHDSLAAAAEAILAVEAAASIGRQTVATVGRVRVSPNSVTTVPGETELWVDIRDVDPETQRSVARAIIAAFDEIAGHRGVRVSIDVVSAQAPVMLAAWVRRVIRDVCHERGVRYRVLPSGAGHDAAVVSRATAAALIFVPCRAGVSHSPLEHADEEDIALGAMLLARCVREGASLLAS